MPIPCYHFDQFHSYQYTCDGPSSRNYCRGCIAASHYRHEINPPKLLVATVWTRPRGRNHRPDDSSPRSSLLQHGHVQIAPSRTSAGMRAWPWAARGAPAAARRGASPISAGSKCLLIRVHTDRHYDIHRVAGALRSADAAGCCCALCAVRFRGWELELLAAPLHWTGWPVLVPTLLRSLCPKGGCKNYPKMYLNIFLCYYREYTGKEVVVDSVLLGALLHVRSKKLSPGESALAKTRVLLCVY
ncbi:hypothetical protein Pelo_17660 [Pelomyxa schiedti]|nr:hypothetical protein Pelo_17660 [Pelomyxa schiedti]